MFLIETFSRALTCLLLDWVLASLREKYCPNCLSEGTAVAYVVCIIQSVCTLMDVLLAIGGPVNSIYWNGILN